MRIEQYLNQCLVRSVLETSDQVHTPPTPDEVKYLIKYLKLNGVDPVIIGSTAIFHHLSSMSVKDFRPTADIDLFVNKRLPKPPPGWRKDPDAVGLESWISPSGGYVDFMVSGHRFSDNEAYPKKIDVAKNSPPDYPVASAKQLLKLKLSSLRDKDIQDAVKLARALGLPELSGLSNTQKENYELVKLWVRSIGSRQA